MQQRVLDSLHHWFLNPTLLGSPYVLVDTGATPIQGCARKVVDLLNEFDDADDARWVHINAEIVRAVSSSKEYRRMLGIDEQEPSCEPTSTCGIRRVLSAFAKRGRFVVNHPEATRVLTTDPKGFRAAIGSPLAGIEPFHLILNPNCFPPQCLASLIADSYLEWAATSCAA
ncbi:hypothetical protein [Haloferula sp. A504]|jgi:hypothetical protein|uniref:hypothetical protein n=1 Tax=Haloferula sp. A504 TaxID=3373601 RepID=UPI0031BC997E|nr:hypothetical protein [Verrucomicrobiaceae bacterium E54]